MPETPHYTSEEAFKKTATYEQRKEFFRANGIKKYIGSTEQNEQAMSMLTREDIEGKQLREKYEKAFGIIKTETKNSLFNLKKNVSGSKNPFTKLRSIFTKKDVPEIKKEQTTTKEYIKDASVYHEAEDEWGGKTALGNKLHYSADPDVPTSCATNWGKFPPGTLLRINGKKYIVEDYGSFVNNHPDRIDRFMPKSIYKPVLDKNPQVEVLQMGDFARAAEILKTRHPAKNRHIAMMLRQAQERLV